MFALCFLSDFVCHVAGSALQEATFLQHLLNPIQERINAKIATSARLCASPLKKIALLCCVHVGKN